jgi:serine/threonine-protein kinase
VNEPNTDLDTAAGQFALSAAGHLIYLAGGMFPDVIGTLVWLDRDGRLTALDTPPRGYQSPQLSPDARRIVVQSVGVERAVWVVDISRGTASKLQFDGLAEWPIWTPDGQRVVFSGSKNGVQNLYWMRADGSDSAERLTTSEFNQLAATWSADGRELIFIEERQKTRDDIYALSIADRTTRPILENPAGETHPTISPDGRWLAYVSDDSGRAEVFVTPYGGPAGRVQVSVAGGSNPRWTRDGRELVFSVPVRDGVRTIMSAAITGAPVLAAGVPRRFTAVASDEFSSTTPIPGFDIAADGRLLGATRRRPAAPPPTSFSVLLNWAELLRTRTGR